MSWQPLLTGKLADQARQVVDEIRAALPPSFPPLDLSDAAPRPAAVRTASFEAGRGAAAMLEHYCSGDGGSDGTWERAAIDESVAATRWLIDPATPTTGALLDRPPLGVGPLGVAWMLAHLGMSESAEQQEILAWADERARRLVSAMPWPSDYDLVVGLVGLGTYTLERLPAPSAAPTLELIVERLADLAEHYPDGLAWRTWPEMIIGHADRCPIGRYDLGLAHGVAGVIAFLGHTAVRGIARDRLEPVLRAAVSWLLARKDAAEGPFQFPSWTQPDAAPLPGRLAWCYGDLGIALALLAAARGLQEVGWELDAIEIARYAARGEPQRMGVVDAALCHGAFGVAHCLNRLAQSTSDDELSNVARTWYERGLSLQQPGQGLAGYSAIDVNREGARRRVVYRGLVQGVAGIGLALEAAVSSIEPAWDRVMLVGPPAAARPAG